MLEWAVWVGRSKRAAPGSYATTFAQETLQKVEAAHAKGGKQAFAKAIREQQALLPKPDVQFKF